MKKPAPQQPKATPKRLKGWKRWAFPLAAMILVPGLFFVLLELGLRVIGYGFPTEFLIKRKLAGATVYTDNRQYGWRFFPRAVARRPADIVLPAEKPAGTFRIFVLGESAAMGDPDNAYGLPRILDVMLSDQFPSVRFEVVNAAMTGISSHIIRDIASDCARFQPDCFVIYMGNNEAIGPYGPGTVFASFSKYLALTRLSINARSLKTSQMIDSLIRLRSKSDQPGAWGGLRVFMKSQFHPSDPRLAVLAEHFEANLKAICETGRKAGAKLILCSVASNLSDCSPFASLNSPSLSLDQKNAWDAKWEMAGKLETQSKTEAALKACQEAEAIDPSFAELHFRKGRLYTALHRPKEAHESFTRARDCDALKFRTSSDLNKQIKQLTETIPSSDATFADVVKTIEEESTATGVGSNHFVDHVHFSFHGNYVAARAIFNAVSHFVPDSARTGQTNQATVLTEQQCAERLAFTRWNQKRIAEYMLKRFEIPPFNSKSDFAQRSRELQAQITQLSDAATPHALEEALAMYHKALQRRKSDPDFLKRLAELHAELDQPAEEIKYCQALYELFPYDQDRKAYLAEAYARSGNHADGEKLAREVLDVDSTQVIAHLALATALEKKGSLDAAIAEYKEVLRWRPDMANVREKLDAFLNPGQSPISGLQNFPGSFKASPQESQKHFELGQKLLQDGRTEEALKELQTAARLDSSFAEVYMAMAVALVQQNKVEEAIAQCKEALRARPGFVQAHNELGALLTDLDRLAEARTHLEEAIRLEPENEDVHLNLGLNLLRDNRSHEALVYLEFYVKKHSDDAVVHHQIGMVYEGAGLWEKAANSHREALRLQPENEQYQSSLAWILATSPLTEVRNGQEAVRLAQAACRAPNQQAYLLDTLAAALAETGRYPEAVKAAQDALALARASKAPETEDIDKRVLLYKSNKPYRSETNAHGATAAASSPK